MEFGGKIEQSIFEQMLPVLIYYMEIAHGKPAPNIMRIEASLRHLSERQVAYELWGRFVQMVGYRKHDANLMVYAYAAMTK